MLGFLSRRSNSKQWTVIPGALRDVTEGCNSKQTYTQEAPVGYCRNPIHFNRRKKMLSECY